MMFLIRAAFWLSLVILILPADEGMQPQTSADISSTEALTVAQATLHDFTSFCTRQPEVCAAGEVALESFAAKARYGAKQLYMYLDENSEGSAGTDDATGLAQAPGFSEGHGLERQELSALIQHNQ